MLTTSEMRNLGCHKGYVRWSRSGIVEQIRFSGGRIKAFNPKTEKFKHVIGFVPEYACKEISTSEAQITLFAPTPTVRDSGRISIREVISDAISKMSDQELRGLRLPVGIIFDILIKRTS